MKLRTFVERGSRAEVIGTLRLGVIKHWRVPSGLAGAALLLGASLQPACSGGSETPPQLGSGGAGGAPNGGGTSGGARNTGGLSSSGNTGTAGQNSPTGGAGAATTGGAPGSGGASSGGSRASGGAAAAGANGSGTSKAADVARRLGRKANFLIGMGNDLAEDHSKDGAYTLGVTLDLHYAYMVGLKGKGGWPDWNADGGFVTILADSAKAKGVTPMYTLYAMAAAGENNLSALTDAAYMKAYWDGAKLLFQRLGDFNAPALVQFEPDFWGFAQQASKSNPSNQQVNVSALAPDCASQPDNLVGMGKCLVALGRKYAPKALLAFEVSLWADPDPAKVAKFLLDVGASQADLLTTDILDRDAGCFEAHTDPSCQRNDGPWYWDDTNQTSPNFHEYLAWIKKCTAAAGLPILWWQTPFGVPSSTPGGVAGKYRDNRVKYIFEHIQEFIDAGGVGATFGVGAGNQTYIDTDGGQFKNAVTKYYAAPVALP